MSYQTFDLRWDSTAGCSNTGFDQGIAADSIPCTQDTAAGTAIWSISFDFVQFDSQPVEFNRGVPLPDVAPGPCEDDRPLTKDSWYCPECEHLHGRRHYKNWKDGPPYCPHCKWEGESWDEIEFLSQEKIDRLNRERRWTRDD